MNSPRSPEEERDRRRSLVQRLEPHIPPTPAARLALAQVESAWDELEERKAELERWSQRLRLLAVRGPEVLLAADTREVSMEILGLLGEALGADRGLLALSHPQGGHQVIADWGAGAQIQWSEGLVQQAFDQASPLTNADAAGDLRWKALRSVARARMRSVCCLPILVEGLPLGFVWLENRSLTGIFDPAAVELAASWLPVFAQALDRSLREAHGESSPIPGFVTRSSRLLAELRDLARLARFDIPVLLYGETGTGKSMLARALHRISPRAAGPFIHVNCGAVPETLIDAELFGAEKGAYTGATQRRIGHFEAAEGGTLFLDELDSMPASVQVRLLVALQEHSITRLGGAQPVKVDIRVIAATGQDPALLVRTGRLRNDLYYRLGGVVARLPPLRERREDIPALTDSILERVSARHQRPPLSLSARAAEETQRWSWPGNVRELENTLERAALLANGARIDTLRLPDLPTPPSPSQDPGPAPGAAARRKGGVVDMAEFDAAMLQANGDPGEAARLLGIHRRSVMRILSRRSELVSAAPGQSPPE